MLSKTKIKLSGKTACAALCLAGAWAGQSHAAGPDAGALLRQFERELAPSVPGQNPMPVPSVPASQPAERGTSTLELKSFDVQGAKRVAPHEISQVLKAWLDRVITFDDLQKAAQAVEELYRQRGYLALASYPPQTVRDGVIVMQLTEARLGAVVLDESSANFSPDRAAGYITAKVPTGAEISLEAVNRGVAILGEVPGIRVRTALEKGAEEGEVNIRLSLSEAKPYSVRAELNNHGSRTTGSGQVVAQGAIHNPGGWGDQITFSGIKTQGSDLAQVGYNFPLAPTGWRANLSTSSLRYGNVGEFTSNGGKGEANTWSGGGSYPLLRSEALNLTTTVGLEEKTYFNRNLATDAINSHYAIRNLSAGLSGYSSEGLFSDAMVSGQLTLTSGEIRLNSDTPPTFGAYNNGTGYVPYIPSRFLKLSFSVNRTQNLDRNARLLISFSGQLAAQNLNSAEQFYLGGPYGVRAYPVSQGSGAQGFLATAEYQQPLDDKLQLIAFFDAGRVRQYIDPYPSWQGQTHAANSYALYGAGFGVRWSIQGFNLSATVGWKIGNNPLYNQQGRAIDIDNTNRNPRGWLTASYSY